MSAPKTPKPQLSQKSANKDIQQLIHGGSPLNEISEEDDNESGFESSVNDKSPLLGSSIDSAKDSDLSYDGNKPLTFQ